MKALTLTVDAEPGKLTKTRAEAWADLVSAEAIKARVLRGVGKPLAPPYVVEVSLFVLEPENARALPPWPQRRDLGVLADATLRGLREGRLLTGNDGNVVSLLVTTTTTFTVPRAHITIRSHADRYQERR